MTRKLFFTIFSLTLGFCSILLKDAWSYGQGPQNIVHLTNTANIICKGRVLDVAQLTEQAQSVGNGLLIVKTMIAKLQVDRVFKGNMNGNTIEIEFSFSNTGSHDPILQQDEYCLVFLKPSGNRYAFSDPQGKMPISSEPIISERENYDTLSMLELELLNSLRATSKNVALTAIEQLGNLPKIRSTQPLKELLATINDREVEGKIHTSLIKLRDYSEFQNAIKLAEFQENAPQTSRLQASMAHTISIIRDPQALPQLYALTNTKNDLLRVSAFRALRSIKNPASIKYLIEGLNDNNKDVRYQCVMALAEIEGKGAGWGAARDIYDASEQGYVSRWRGWWEAEGKHKYSTR